MKDRFVKFEDKQQGLCVYYIRWKDVVISFFFHLPNTFEEGFQMNFNIVGKVDFDEMISDFGLLSGEKAEELTKEQFIDEFYPKISTVANKIQDATNLIRWIETQQQFSFEKEVQ